MNKDVDIIIMTMVHGSHCCTIHGCKYGDEDCPVVLKTEPQQFPCEYCSYAKEEHEHYTSGEIHYHGQDDRKYPPMFPWLVLDRDGCVVESNTSKAEAIAYARGSTRHLRVVKVEIVDELDFWEDE